MSTRYTTAAKRATAQILSALNVEFDDTDTRTIIDLIDAELRPLVDVLAGMYELACDDDVSVPDRLYHHVTAAAALLRHVEGP